MQTVWKFPILITNDQDIEMPAGAKILCAQMQQGELCVWAQVNPEAKKTTRKIMVYGTGHGMPDIPHRYIGTFQMMQGQLVFHVYEEGDQ